MDSKVLILTNITREDRDEDPWEKLLGEKLYCTNVVIEPRKIYNKIHTVYEKHSWPLKNNIWCWNCAMDFSTMPIFIPTFIEDKTDRMGVLGNFCSFPCAARFVEMCPEEKRSDYNRMLKYLHYIMTGRKVKHIIPMISKFELDKFGGNKSSEEFINIINTLNSQTLAQYSQHE
jgi:hypothetical protein